MGSRKCIFKKTTKCSLLAVGMLATVFGYGADIRNGALGRSGGTTSARLTIGIIVVPIVQTSPAPTPHPANPAIDYNFTGKRGPYEVRTRAEKLPSADGHKAAVLETLTIVPE